MKTELKYIKSLEKNTKKGMLGQIKIEKLFGIRKINFRLKKQKV